MSDNREEILASFQECTGIDNIEEAIMWLDTAQWDLLTAINNAVPEDAQMRMFHGSDNRNEIGSVPVTISNDFIKPSSTSSSERILDFEVHHNTKIFKLQVPESMTVGCVKTLIYADTRIPPCQQAITGWPGDGKTLPSDDTPLRKLNLSEVTILHINSSGSFSFNDDFEMEVDEEPGRRVRKQKFNPQEAGDIVSRPSGSSGSKRKEPKIKSERGGEATICLKVHDGNQNQDHTIRVPPCQTVGDVKKNVANLTGILIPQQTWLGWPDEVADSAKLSDLDLDRPHHHLTVVKLVEERRRTRSRTRSNLVSYSPDPSDSGAETDSFEDASESFSVEDEMFNEEVTVSNKIAPLMPDNIEDETIGSVSFIDGYNLRYGPMSPNFFSGPLENAINEAFMKNGRDKRMLTIYLHHDGSILTNVFCSQLLGSEAILQLFATYFVLWGWDMTNRRNREMLLNSVERQLGQSVYQAILGIKLDDFPALLIVSKVRSTVELLNVIRGNIGAQELLSMLVTTIDVFTERLEVEIQNEEERAARDRIKFEQDMAYQESLNLDKAKEESKRQQQLLQEQEEERLKREEEQLVAEKLAVESRMPDEPAEDASSKEIMTFRFRTPTGENFVRRFRVSETLQTVFDYLLVKGFKINDFKLITAFPRKDLSTLEGASLLKDAGLCPQETLTLEER